MLYISGAISVTMKKLSKPFVQLQQDLAFLEDFKNPGNFFLKINFFQTNKLSLEFSDIVILSSTDKRQPWHVDTPIQGVFTNILYLDSNVIRTEFLEVKKKNINFFH